MGFAVAATEAGAKILEKVGHVLSVGYKTVVQIDGFVKGVVGSLHRHIGKYVGPQQPFM